MRSPGVCPVTLEGCAIMAGQVKMVLATVLLGPPGQDRHRWVFEADVGPKIVRQVVGCGAVVAGLLVEKQGPWQRIGVVVDIHLDAQAGLLEIIDAGRLLRLLLGLGQGGQQQSRQNGDDGDDDEEFNEGEGPLRATGARVVHKLGIVWRFWFRVR